MNTFVIHHRKGGVGKTTSVQHLAKAASLANLKTLIIDTDGQANLSTAFKIENNQNNLFHLLKDLMNRKEPLIENYISQISNNLDLIASSSELFNIQDEISHFKGMRAHILSKLKPQFKNYNIILIDTPPQAGWLVSNALIIADKILAPISCESFSVDGLSGLSQSLVELGELNNQNNKALNLSYIFPTMFHASRNAHQQLLDYLKKQFPKLITNTIIRTDANIETAQSKFQTVFEYAPNTRAAKDYISLLEEILDEK